MKLRNSLTEASFRKSLVEGKKSFTESTSGPKVIRHIEKSCELITIYPLRHIPEQGGEDSLILLVNGEKVIFCDLILDGTELSVVNVEEKSVEEYQREIKHKMDRLHLLVALDLSKQDTALIRAT